MFNVFETKRMNKLKLHYWNINFRVLQEAVSMLFVVDEVNVASTTVGFKTNLVF